jgi:hypothetical protein
MFKGLTARRLYKSFGVKGLTPIGTVRYCLHKSVWSSWWIAEGMTVAFVYQKIPQQHKINTSRALSDFRLLSAARLPSYVPYVVSLILCMSS